MGYRYGYIWSHKRNPRFKFMLVEWYNYIKIYYRYQYRSYGYGNNLQYRYFMSVPLGLGLRLKPSSRAPDRVSYPHSFYPDSVAAEKFHTNLDPEIEIEFN